MVVDPVGDRFADPALRALGWMGRYLVIGFAGGEIPRLPVNQVLLNNRTLIGVDWGAWTMRDAAGNQALLAELMDLAGSGALHPVEPHEYPLDDVVGALTDLQDRKVAGKVVLIPDAVQPARRPARHHWCRCSSSVAKAKRSCS